MGGPVDDLSGCTPHRSAPLPAQAPDMEISLFPGPLGAGSANALCSIQKSSKSEFLPYLFEFSLEPSSALEAGQESGERRSKARQTMPHELGNPAEAPICPGILLANHERMWSPLPNCGATGAALRLAVFLRGQTGPRRQQYPPVFPRKADICAARAELRKGEMQHRWPRRRVPGVA
jgi:hypothetical protein